MSLSEYAHTNHTKNIEFLKIFNEYKEPNNFIHSMQALDIDRMNMILDNGLRVKFNPNVADYSYVFTWLRPINRNLPKFLFESALNTKAIEIIELLLNLNCNVNLPNSMNGDPFYFYAFDIEYHTIKEKILVKANYEIKNIKGRSVLYHILSNYLKNFNNREVSDTLIKDFKKVLLKNIFLIYQRDHEGCTLVETIISLPAEQYKHGSTFLKLINNFIFDEIFVHKNLKLFLEFIYNGYSLILINTKFDFNRGERDGEKIQKVNLIEYIKEKCDEDFNKFTKIYLDASFFKILNNFNKLIKTGDFDSLKRLILTDNLRENLIDFNDYGGRSCLHIAVLYNNIAIVK
jgi:hypothetical protein